jgi:hypothetical protein
MGDAYRIAKRVVVWLGPEEKKTSSFAVESLGFLSSEMQVDWHMYEMKLACPQEDVDWADDRSELRYENKTLDTIYNFLNRLRFERPWVQQEIRLANPSAVVVCGSDTMLWQEFCDATFCIRLKPKTKSHPALTQRLSN